MTKKYLAIFIKVVATSAFFSSSLIFAKNEIIAGETTAHPTTHTITANTADAAQITMPDTSSDVQLVRDLCPNIEDLKFNPTQRTWSASKGWKTLQTSFLQTVDAFIGAQWVGVGIGQVICIYTKIGKDTFPVTLQRGLLVPAPTTGGLWSTGNGYMGCKSHDVADCPFFVQIPKPVKNLYDELNFKEKPKNTQP